MEERTRLERVARAATSSERDAVRARVVLVAGEGLENVEIAAELGLHPDTVCDGSHLARARDDW